MNTALAQLIRISNATGKDATLVQGGGGNTSVKTKDGGYMYIKASGTALRDMNRQKGWRRLRLDLVLSIIKDKSIAQLDVYSRETEVVNRLLFACDDNVTGARPSVESHLHSFLGKCVIHLHPNAVGAYVNAKNGKARLERLFKAEKLPFLWVPYTDPGFELAKRIAKLVTNYRRQFGRTPQILFLEKHGLIVSADNPDTALRIVRRVINGCNSRLKQLKAAKSKPANKKIVTDAKLCVRRAFFEATGRHTTISYFYNETIAAFCHQKDAQKMLSSAVLTPDELLYANGPAMWVDKCDAEKIAAKLAKQIETGKKHSVAFLVKGIGLFIAAKEKFVPTVRDVVLSSFFIRTNAFRMGGILSLNKRQQDFINKWESDVFRKKLLSG